MPPEVKEQDGDTAHAEALANYTDALLDARPTGKAPGLEAPPELGGTVRQLAQALPADALPSGLRQRVMRQIRAEWKETRTSRWARISKAGRDFWRGLARSLQRQPAWAAIAILALVGAIAALATRNPVEVAGTVTGISPGGWAALLGAAALITSAVFWWRKRR